jgi:hypothetical protein
MTVNTSLPVDTVTMRATTARLLADDAAPPSPSELDTLTLTLKGCLQLLIPEVERAAAPQPTDDIPRVCARAVVEEARRKLDVVPRPGVSAGTAHARRLSRSVNALCDHLEILDSARL